MLVQRLGILLCFGDRLQDLGLPWWFVPALRIEGILGI